MVRAGSALCFALLAACGGGPSGPRLDGGRPLDGRPADAAASADAPPPDGASRDAAAVDAAAVDAAAVDAARADASPLDAPAAYRHGVTIDGVDDFLAGEAFTTTSSPGYAARVTWDDQKLYVGYAGPDVGAAAPDAGFKWLFVYLDLDPGAATGATTTLTYNTQRAAMPSGFGAELYYRWKADGSFASLEQRGAGGGWTTSATAVAVARAGTFVELAIPRTALGGAGKVGVVTWMINEKALAESSYAGLYGGNFTDGYAPTLALTKYLLVNFASPATPNDPANEGP